jgi:hypothetical protein
MARALSESYAVDDREKHIAILRELRRRRHAARAERPPSLLKSVHGPP